jgi:hypothetical protein
MFRFFKTPDDSDIDPRIAETKTLIAECEKILSRSKSRPMARYWAKTSLASATKRLSQLEARQAQRDARNRTKSHVIGHDVPTSRFDPMTKPTNIRKDEPIALGAAPPAVWH